MVNVEEIEVLIDEEGKFNSKTRRINGLLKGIVFKLDPQGMGLNFNVSIKLMNSNIEIFNERDISSDQYYSLKVQDRDGFGQYFSQSNSDYVLDDNLIINVEGNPNDKMICILRWL